MEIILINWKERELIAHKNFSYSLCQSPYCELKEDEFKKSMDNILSNIKQYSLDFPEDGFPVVHFVNFGCDRPKRFKYKIKNKKIIVSSKRLDEKSFKQQMERENGNCCTKRI